jgi:2-oxoglutarate dehydrogenase E1 component
MAELTHIGNLPYLEALYRAYRADPASVAPEWRAYFAEVYDDNGQAAATPAPIESHPIDPAPSGDAQAPSAAHSSAASLQNQLNEMIRVYRACGHLKARIDPLALRNLASTELAPESFGFSTAHSDMLFASDAMALDAPLSLREIVERLENTYCGSIGVEFMHMNSRAARLWLQERMERTQNRAVFDRDERVAILTRLIEAQTFEQFIRRKFLGAKSFSLEGAEGLIPLLDAAIEKAAEQGVREIVLGMAHRGRLNVLANVLRKKPRDIFCEFIDPSVAHADGSGDVKYHLGHSNDYHTRSGRKVHLSLCFNPSHLEFVNPVALGRVRAKQDRAGDRERAWGIAVLIHGDAAFPGEGIIQETLNLSRLEGYKIGGTVHVVLNNQIGFTTAPQNARSSTYATDIARMLQIPIFHVNGDDPEALVHVVRLALEFRAKFREDVVIDMYCYRRLGHNEGDEPSFTQPLLYRRIKEHRPVQELYLERLIELDCSSREQARQIQAERLQHLEEEFAHARDARQPPGPQALQGVWANYRGGLESEAEEARTGLALERLRVLLERQMQLPEDFHPHPKIERAMAARRQMAEGKQPLDWSAAESLAFASLSVEGVRVRLSGQDSARGTFSQRHAVLHDYQDGHEYVPLRHLAADQAPVEIYDSPLSEAGVLGFDYGYSLDCPEGLVLWEAQFGDFSNAAQVLIDQFITTAEEKWRRLSGIVLLLPHGFEGMGPEHSSARLERFLQLGARDNMQVVYPTTPAQYFHCLRRQALRRWRKPLVMMTPKSLLRHPQAVSSLDELSRGKFQPVIGAAVKDAPGAPDRVLLCSGKVFYDLSRKQRELKRPEVPIIRLEQLYPFPEQALRSALTPYREDIPLVWVQEEPQNMGAWWYLHLQLGRTPFKNKSVSVIARPASASPAIGSATRHKEQQERLLDAAFHTELRPAAKTGLRAVHA